MRVLHVIAAYEPRMGGAVHLFRHLARELVATGDEVEVWTSDAAESEYFWDASRAHVQAGVTEEDSVTIRRMRVAHFPKHWKVARLLGLVLPWRWKAFFDPPSPFIPELFSRARLAATSADVVHGGAFPLDSMLWATYLACRRAGTPWFVTPLIHFGRGEQDRPEVERFFLRRHQVEMLRGATGVFALSESERAGYEELGVEPGRIHVLRPGVDPAELDGGDGVAFRQRHGIDGPMVLHVANHTEAKGTLTLIEAARMLWEEGSPLHLVLIGPSMPDYREAMATIGPPGPRFHDLGFVDEEEKRDAYAACDVFALPSRADTLGLVFLEAWYCGKPVIGARAGGIPDLIRENEDGLLVEFGQPEELAAAIGRLLSEADSRRRLGEAGRERVIKDFTWEQMAAQVREAYAAACEAAGARRC
jgi:glycogen(starch) synthase